jgi:large repetitive protein
MDLVDHVAADLNGDGNEEILAINEANDRLKIFLGDNLGGLTRQVDLFTGRAPKAVTVGDLNGDGLLEIITANRAGRSISVFTGSIVSGYNSIEIPVGNGPIDVKTADVNGDGHLDVLVLDDSANALWILTGSSAGTLADPIAIALGDKPGRFTVADATGDGQLNAIITLPESNRVMILSGLDLQPNPPAPIYINFDSSPSDVVVTDLNADGKPDLAVALPNENVLSVLFGLGGGQFARPQRIAVGEQPTRVTLADADEDSRMDLIVANSGDGTASVIYNRFDPNEVYRYNSQAIDPDDDPITYSIVDGPGGLIINSETGALLWAASPDQVGVHEVTLQADDGRGGTATQSFKIDVQPPRENAAPLFATEPSTTIGANETFTYQAIALDSDRDTLRYRLLDGPTGAAIDPTTGEVAWDARADLAVSFAPHGNTSTGRIEVAPSPSLRPASLTVEAWFNFTSPTAGNGRSNLIVQPSGGNSFAYSLYNLFNNQLRLQMDFSGATPSLIYSVPFIPQIHRWYHIALTIDDASRTATIYADGVALGTTAIPEAIDYNPDARAHIGDYGAFYTRAIVDNYRLWNVSRTPAEVVEGMSRQYEGDSRIVLDYRFDLPDTLTVRDYSPAGNHGYRIANGLLPPLVPGLANPGSHEFVISVEDGRGGFDTQTFTVEVLPELRGSIRGQIFDDLNGDGLKDPDESGMAGWHLFIDSNGNGFADPHELQTTTDAQGNYRFDGLLPGEYPLRISTVAGYAAQPVNHVSVTANGVNVTDIAIDQLPLGHIRGQLRTEDDTAIAHWRVFADLDGNGLLDVNEPSTISDRDGYFALSGLSAGTFNIRASLPAGWSNIAGRDGLTVALAADEIAADNDFVLRPTNTSVTSGLHFVTLPHTSLDARETFRYASVAMGLFNEAIVYDLSLAPDGMTIDPATGLVAWRPTIGQVGEHLVILRATSASGSIALQDFYINVTAPNTAPAFAGVVVHQPQKVSTQFPTAFVGRTYAVDLIAQDADGHAITFGLVDFPGTATLNATTGALRWLPEAIEVGIADFTILLTDSMGATSTASFSIEVLNQQPNSSPFQIVLPRTVIGLGQDYLGQVAGLDALGRPLSWSLQSGPDSMTVSSTGTLRWSPGNSDLGSHLVVLQATDVDGAIETTSFDLQVVGRPVNSAPQITSTPLTSTVIGGEYRYNVQFEDRDSDVVAFALLESPAGMSIHPSLGTVRWMPVADQLGESTVTIQVADPDGRTDTQTYKLNVSRFGGPPRISSIPPTEAAIGTGYLYSVLARDAEGDPLTYRLLAAPAGMTITPTTGEIVWTPAPEQLGSQDVVIEVSDGVGGAVTQAFAIRVRDGLPNLPPVITSSAPRLAVVGAAYEYNLIATDPEGTLLSYSLGQAPEGLTIDSETGQVRWTPAAGQAGQFVVTLIVTDEGGASAVESFELDVLAENSPPVISSTAPGEVMSGVVFTYQVLASDADLDPLTYTLTAAPAGATIDAFGKITWPTTGQDLGDHEFEVEVSDPRGGVATQRFTLSVVADTEPPKLSLIERPNDGSRNILPWQGPFVVYVRAIDNVGIASLTLTANGRDIPLDAAGTAIFTFEEWTFQRINATATAVDTSGNVTTRTISFDYDFPEGWSGAGTEDIPTAIISSPTDTQTVFGIVSITGTAAHENFAAYKLSYRRVDETSYTEFLQSDTPVTNGQLGVWDTSLLINDEYVIRLEVATNTGIVNVVEHNVGLAGELKLGNFRLSFTDMVIPVAGIPIEITRIYDTLQADRQGDFGYGWRLEYRDTDLRVGLPKSGLEDIGIFPALRPGVKVFLNVPGEGRQGFTFDPDIRVLPGFGGNNLVLARPRFRPDPGVTSTLGTGISGYLQVNELGELFAPGGIPYNPASPDFGGAYVVTTREGITYRVDGATGRLLTATTSNDRRLSFSESGIWSGDDLLVEINRDQAGRITEIIDAEGGNLEYSYVGGRLDSSIDRNQNQTRYLYDAETGFLSEIIDPLGRVGIRNEYDSEGRLIEQGDPRQSEGVRFTHLLDDGRTQLTLVDGSEVIYQFDNRGRVIAETDELGNTTQYTHDETGIREIIDPLGQVTRFTRDAQGRILQEILPDGSGRFFEYDSNGDVTSDIDELGNATYRIYDQSGNLLQVMRGERVVALQYDEQGNLVSTIRSDGSTVQQSFDQHGLLMRIAEQDGADQVFQRDRLGRELSQTIVVTTAEGIDRDLTVARRYDASGNTTAITDAAGNEAIQSYDSLHNLATVQDGTGRTLVYDHAGSSLLHQVTFGDQSQVGYEYDERQRVSRVIDRSGEVSELRYDAAGNLTERLLPDDTPETLADNPRYTYEYDSLNRPVAVTNPLGARSETRYDSRGRVLERIDALGHSTFYDYDAAGRLVRETDAAGNSTQYEYDRYGNLLATIYSDGSRSSFEYDEMDRLLQVVDPVGDIQKFEYDAAGNLTSVIDGEGFRTSYEYDQVGNRTARIDASGNRTTYAYNELNLLASITRPDGAVSTRTYRPDGSLQSETDFSGQTTQYIYDANGRLSEILYADTVADNFSYDDAGNRTTIENEVGTVSQEFDGQGRLVRHTDPFGTVVEYAYDGIGQLTQVHSAGSTTTYEYDLLGRINRVLVDGAEKVRFAYDEVGNRISATYANGLTETFNYDSRSRLAQQILQDTQSALVSSNSYEYDAAGRLIKQQDHIGQILQYEYNSRGEITQFTAYSNSDLDSHIQYHYDAVGNPLKIITDGVTETSTFDTLGQRQTRTRDGESWSFSYDLNGNLTSVSLDGEIVEQYEWDRRGRLIESQITDGNFSDSVSYLYDWSGLLIERTQDGQTVRYSYQRSTPLPQLIAAASSSSTESYVHANRLLLRNDSDGEAFYHHDVSGHVRLETSDEGLLLRSQSYTPFGTSLQPASATPALVDFGFADAPVDSLTGLSYLRQRHYSSDLRHFVSTDPYAGDLNNPLSQNSYQYALNSPLNFGDPSGEIAMPTVAELQVAASIAATITAVSAVQVIAGMGGLSGGEVRFQGPLLSFGVGVGIGVEFSVDLYSGLLASDRSFTGGPGKKDGYRLSGGAGISFGTGIGVGAYFGPNGGAVDVGFNLNPVTRFLGGTALSGALVLADASAQFGAGETPASYLAMGFAKGNANGGSVGFGFGGGASYKTGVYVALSVAVEKSDAEYVHSLGNRVGENRLPLLIDAVFANYF